MVASQDDDQLSAVTHELLQDTIMIAVRPAMDVRNGGALWAHARMHQCAVGIRCANVSDASDTETRELTRLERVARDILFFCQRSKVDLVPRVEGVRILTLPDSVLSLI